jgi:hypothetical protein
MLASEHAEKQARAGARVAEIQHIIWFGKTAQPDPVYEPAFAALPLNPSAERTHRRHRTQHVICLKEAANDAAANGKTRDNYGAVRDRFIAGNVDIAAEASSWRRE